MIKNKHMKIRNTAVPAVPSKLCKLSADQRNYVFHAFDIASAVLRENKCSYIRRYSEPCKGGHSYRCKFWAVWTNQKMYPALYKKVTTALNKAGYKGTFTIYSNDGSSIILKFNKFLQAI